MLKYGSNNTFIIKCSYNKISQFLIDYPVIFKLGLSYFNGTIITKANIVLSPLK